MIDILKKYPIYDFGEENVIVVDNLYFIPCPTLFIYKINKRPIEDGCFLRKQD